MKNLLKLTNGISVDFVGKELVVTNKKVKILFNEMGEFSSLEFIEPISDSKGVKMSDVILDADHALKLQITELLLNLGISPGLFGYHCLKTALFYVCKDSSYLKSLNKNLYVIIAKENNDKGGSVERAIRHAITISLSKGDKSLLEEIFGKTVNLKKEKPTNKQFIAGLVEYLVPER